MAEVLSLGISRAEGQSMIDASNASRARVLYTSGSAADANVTGANVRSSMLPPSSTGGATTIAVPAGAMPIGAHIYLIGTGLIGARTLSPPGFNLVGTVTPAGGAKVDLPGFAYAPLLGADGICEIWMKFTQLAGGLRTSGVVRYGVANGMAYSISLNSGTNSTLPAVVASDPSVDRAIGVDGFWGGGADAREYVRCRAVTATLFPPA